MGTTKVRNEQITSEAAGDGQVLTADGAGVAAWEAVPAVANHDHSGDAGDGGTFDAANLTAGASTDGQVLTSDGAGGAAWEPPPGGGVATDAIWDAAGDLVQGTGADAAARLAIGTAYQVLQANSAANANIFGPALNDWTPVFVQGNQTPALTVTYAKYIRLGTLCIAWGNVLFSGAGQAANAISLTGFPESTLMTTQIVGIAHVYDNANKWYIPDCVYIPGATDAIQFVCDAATGLLGANPAYTIANGDVISVLIAYPI